MYKIFRSLIAALLVFIFSPGVEFSLGGGENQVSDQSSFSFDPGWREKLETITGNLVQMPNPSFVEVYLNSLEESNQLAIQTYELTEKRVKSRIEKMAKAGMKIRIMIENKKYQQYQNTFKNLQKAFSGLESIELRSDEHLPIQYLHGKITLVQSGFWIQSSNLTHSTFAKNREHLFRSQHPGVLTSLWKIFEKDWKGEELNPSDLHPNLVVCNLNCREIIVDMLSGAQKSIMIQTQYLTDPELFDMIAQKSEQLSFKAIFSATESNQELPKYFGPHQVRLLKKPYVHTKMILIDEELLLLGSMNLSANSLDNNREYGILLQDKTLIQQFMRGFEQDWIAAAKS